MPYVDKQQPGSGAKGSLVPSLFNSQMCDIPHANDFLTDSHHLLHKTRLVWRIVGHVNSVGLAHLTEIQSALRVVKCFWETPL